jgi:15-cis-phytoene synthase
MSMQLYRETNQQISRLITNQYSTSFSSGVKSLSAELQPHIYNIYGLVRYADEIVDTFDKGNKQELLNDFIHETWKAIEQGISINPVIDAFQQTYHAYNLVPQYLQAFFDSMKMDLDLENCDAESYQAYIYGSAECVGLMCLCVFCEGNSSKIQELEPYARKLGSAFQKVNFLRDIKDDFEERGRFYFPNTNMSAFSNESKREIEADIYQEYQQALLGIQQLPLVARGGVYLAFLYYQQLLVAIQKVPASKLLTTRVRVPNYKKALLFFKVKTLAFLKVGMFSNSQANSFFKEAWFRPFMAIKNALF